MTQSLNGTSHSLSPESAEAQLISTWENMGEGFIACDGGWRFIYVNAKAEGILGISREELLGRSYWEVLPLTIGTRLEDEYRCSAAGETRDFENYYEPWDRWFLNRCFPRAGGGIVVYFQDITDRKRTERLEARINHALEAAHAGSWEWSLADNRNTWSETLWHLYGLSPGQGEPSFATWKATIHPAERDRVAGIVTEAAAQGLEFEVEWRVNLPEGESERWLRSRGRPFQDAGGKLERYLGIAMDITERKKSVESLRISEAKYRTLFDNIQEIVTVYEVERDDTGRIIERRLREGNPAFVRAIGVSSIEEIRGKTSSEIFGVEWARKPLQTIREAMTSGEVRQTELYHPDKKRYYTTTVVPLDNDSYLDTGRDITELKQVEATLRESTLRIQQALQIGRAFTFEWLQDTDRVFRSDSCASILKLSGDEAINDTGLSFIQKIHPDDRESFVGLLMSLSPENDNYVTEYRMVCCDGSEVVLAETGRAFFDYFSRMTRLLGVTTDVTARKRAEEELRKSEDMLRLITNNSPDPIFIKDRESRWLYINPALERLMGKPAVELLGKRPYEVFADPEISKLLLETDQRIMRSDQAEVIEETIDTTVGRRTFLATKAPWYDGQGAIAGLIGIARDVTERKQTEEHIRNLNISLERKVAERTAELHASEEQYRAVVADQTELISRYRPGDDTLTFVNVAYCQFFGKNREELVGQRWQPQAVAEDIPQVEAALRRLSETNPTVTIENRVIDAQHNCRWMQFVIHGFFDQNGKLVEIQSVGRDISEQKTIEKQLKETQELFSLYMRYSPIYAYIKRIEGNLSRIVMVSDNFIDMVGIPASELRDRTMDELFPADFAHKITDDDIQVVNEGKAIEVDEELNGRNYKTIKFPIQRQGKENLLAGFTLDITDIKRHERDLLAASEAADTANQAKSQFLVNMSHEIRTPMNAIIGLGHLALQTELTDRQRDYLDKITLSAEGLLRLLNDLLDFSKIEAGKLEIEKSTYSLLSLMEKSLGLAGVGASAKGIQLRLGYDPDIPEYLVGDPLRLEQVLLNLLGNAVKFTSSGSVGLTVTPVRKEGRQIILEFSVQDSGIGMTAEQIDGIFKPFSQADSSITRRFGGTGLGLNICKRLVELMGGEIRVESTPGKGSCFSFTVRLERGSAPVVVAERKLQRDTLMAALAGSRVLVVDDQSLNRQILQELLERVGVSVAVAEHGRQALDVVAQAEGKFDAVFMDLQMPEMDGYEATRLLRKEWQFPIIAVTAHASKEERKRCLQAGMNDHLSKPVNPEQLYACILKWVGNDDRQEMLSPHISESGLTEQLPNILPGLDIYAGVAQLGGNTTLYRKLIIQFGQAQEARIADLRSDLDAGELDQAGRKAHGLKGIAGNLGATTVFALAGELEQACARNCAADAELLFPMLVERMAELSVAAAILTGGETSGQEIATSDLDTGAILELIRKLGIMVEEHNLAAQKFSELLCDHVAGTELAPQAVALTDSLTQVDFRTAKRRLEELTTSIRSWIF